MAGSGFWLVRPSSSVMRSSWYSASAWIASDPGSNSAVGVRRRSEPSTISPKRSKLKYSRITSDCGKVTRMPSDASKSSTLATGKARFAALGSGLPLLWIATPAVDEICVMPKNSETSPSTRTTSPMLTSTAGAELPSNTKMPSEVSGFASASASSSCTKKPLRSPLAPTVSWKSPTTTPSMATTVPTSGLAAPSP